LVGIAGSVLPDGSSSAARASGKNSGRCRIARSSAAEGTKKASTPVNSLGQPLDSKLSALKECLTKAEFHELHDGRGKLLIFTEHRDTLKHLREHLESWRYAVCEIHGGMNPHERKKTQEEFRTSQQICVATEAAGSY
jgi:superfamily II DNA/RNA helicase